MKSSDPPLQSRPVHGGNAGCNTFLTPGPKVARPSRLLVFCRRSARGAFSLIELTAVLALMALLATFVTLSVRHVMVKAKQNAARSQIAALRDAVEKYYLDTGHYPTNDQGLAILTSPPGKKSEPLLRNIPLDPWNHPYRQLTRNQSPRTG